MRDSRLWDCRRCYWIRYGSRSCVSQTDVHDLLVSHRQRWTCDVVWYLYVAVLQARITRSGTLCHQLGHIHDLVRWLCSRSELGGSFGLGGWCGGKVSYRSVSSLTGTGSSRWSGSPVPALAGEVVHQLESTESPVWTGYPGRNELPGSHCWVSFLASLTIVYCRIKELSTEQFWNSDTSTINLRVGPVNSYEHQ
jgi:hypothetical protein